MTSFCVCSVRSLIWTPVMYDFFAITCVSDVVLLIFVTIIDVSVLRSLFNSFVALESSSFGPSAFKIFPAASKLIYSNRRQTSCDSVVLGISRCNAANMKHSNHHLDDNYIQSLRNGLGVKIDTSPIQESLNRQELLLDQIVKVPQVFSRLLLEME